MEHKILIARDNCNVQTVRLLIGCKDDNVCEVRVFSEKTPVLLKHRNFVLSKFIDKPLESNATSLHGLYTDFDAWVIKYSSIYKRSIHGTQAEKQHEENVDHIVIDVFAANILLKQRHTHNQPIINVKENEGFMFYDYILFKLLDNNSHRHVICRLVRSKL